MVHKDLIILRKRPRRVCCQLWTLCLGANSGLSGGAVKNELQLD